LKLSVCTNSLIYEWESPVCDPPLGGKPAVPVGHRGKGSLDTLSARVHLMLGIQSTIPNISIDRILKIAKNTPVL